MGRKRKRMMIMHRRSKLQEKLAATCQLKEQSISLIAPPIQKSNSMMAKALEEVQQEQEPTEENVIMTIQPYEEEDEVEKIVEELLTNDVEELELEPEKLLKPMDLMKLRKAELLSMANTMGCEVTSKNTKRQIVAAIEKQSA